MKKKRCFTLVEILAVIGLIGLLITGTVISLNSAWNNNQIDTCEAELRDYTTAFKSYYTDYKNIEISPDGNYETVLNEIVEILNDKYLSNDFEIASISPDKKSVKLKSKIKKDPWNNKYEFNIYTYKGVDADNKAGLIIITSNGKDSVSSKSTYNEGNYGDDIIAIVEPNN